MEKRDSFGSSFGVLVAMAGSAIGLGNLWRFPYLVGTNGGAAFIIIYLAFVFLLAMPILYAEFIIGRRSHSNVFGAFKVLAPKSKWGFVGIIAVISALSILSFYSVVGGWTIDYLVKAATLQFAEESQNLSNLFTETVTSNYQPLFYMLVFLLITGVIVISGIEKGIEKYTKIMMPLLFIMVIVIAIRSVTLPGASEGLKFLFKPDFSKVTSSTFLEALGQAFFSLSIGCGTIMTYASYVKKDANIIKISSYTAISDTIFAIIAGTAIMPAVFSFGISPEQGPGLVFVTLPHIFAQLPFGSIIAVLFFFILFIAAVTSSISLLEVAVSYLKEEFKLKRITASIISLSIVTVFGVLCSLSQGVLSDILIFGKNIFDFFDSLSANILIPLGGLFAVIFVGWRMSKIDVVDEITSGNKHKFPSLFLDVVYFSIQYIAPVVIAIVMFLG
jgi:Na+-dependent transporters of the SNF family